MKEFDYIITDPVGIHARPAEKLVAVAKAFNSSITVLYDGKKGDAHKIFSLMTLGARTGDRITVQVEGSDEDEAADRFLETLQASL